MNSLTYALITPSFSKDLERCTLLVQSVERWVAPHVRHYLIIDRRDVHLFKPLASARTEILVVEDIVPNWIVRVPYVRRFWLSLRTRPVKNWVLQQMVKLSIPSIVDADILLYTDSDVFFVDSYDPRTFEREGKVPLFMETGQHGKIPNNDLWHGVASRLLGIPPIEFCDTNYIGNTVCWRRDVALAMLRRVELQAGRSWPLAIAPLSAISEYILYGVHATAVVGEENSGHWPDPEIRTHNYWRTVPLGPAELERFKAERAPHQYAVMISAKSGTKVEDIRRVYSVR
ncbi:MAG: hypothetical protein KGL92_05420 [Gammaproteobacteria bacterium]|nr:hypothetical protein [Gammaproteobacteria bacterium]